MITEPGKVVDSVEVFGMIRVEAPNVTIKRSLLHGDPTLGSIAVYSASPAVKNLVIEDVEISPLVRATTTGGVYGHDFTVRRANIHSVIDQVHVFGGGNVLVENSFLHDNTHFTVDARNADGTHDDNVQVQEGGNIVVRNSVLSGAWNAAVQVTQGLGSSSDIVIDGNWIEGGGCALNISDGSRGTISGVEIIGNRFGATKFNCPILISPQTKAVSTISGNVLNSGRAVQLICRARSGNHSC